LTLAIEVEALRQIGADITPQQLEKLAELEEALQPDERFALRGLSETQSLDVWYRPHYTGDPLADFWEYRITHDLLHPAELELKRAPVRELWDLPWAELKTRI
jgi:hypothetical protein